MGEFVTLGLARGVDFETFSRLVKHLVLVAIYGHERAEIELQLEFFNVPIFNLPRPTPAYLASLLPPIPTTPGATPKAPRSRPRPSKRKP